MDSLTYVNLEDDRVIRAITFVEAEIALSLPSFSNKVILQKLGKISWLYFTPAHTTAEIEEVDKLINKFAKSHTNNINYYLAYHRCYEFAVFYWTVLRANNINCKLVVQELPMRHCYLLRDNIVLDMLFDRCEVPYSYDTTNAQIFDTPHNMYQEVFIPKEDRQGWEVEQLQVLKSLE